MSGLRDSHAEQPIGETEQPPGESGPDEQFVQLFTRHQRKLFLIILAQVGNPVDAEEILQETNLVIWRKSHQFRAGTSFLAWAGRIAHFEILKFRERTRRERLRFSGTFVERIAQEVLEASDELERRRQALHECLERLRPVDRDLIRERYVPGASGKELAERLGRPVNSIYQSLGRIRRTLLECINRRLALEAGP